MQIVCISDTHSMHEKLVVPDGDMLIHAGDLTMQGAAGEIMSAFSWLNKMPHEHVVFVPENHDYGFERNPDLVPVLRHKYPRLTVLMDSGATIAGKRIYGSPFQPYFNDWAFNFSPGPAGQEQAKKKWAKIPDDIEILICTEPYAVFSN